MKPLQAKLLLLAVFVQVTVFAQTKGALKLDGVKAGSSWLETSFRYHAFPFLFEHYLAEGASFPAFNYNGFSRRSTISDAFLWQLDASWRWQKERAGEFWRHASWQTGLVYHKAMIPGQTLSASQSTSLPDGFERTLQEYSNDMHFQLLGLQLGWIQRWQPFRRARRLSFYTGLSWVNMWTLNNEISQTRFFQRSRSSTQGGFVVLEQNSEEGPHLPGQHFRWQRWQVPLGIEYRLGKHLAVAAEFNVGIYRHVMRNKRGRYDEGHGFSARIGYYF
ncbi:MAG: hypothetical protein MUF62_14135 [Chitinophagaceae bacterium]|jgi:hypothetical protein|nr:hypothetical protein [Chitinophagaceae bacterium]